MAGHKPNILGINVDAVSLDDAAAILSNLVTRGRREGREGRQRGKGYHVVTLNPEMIYASQRDSQLREAINDADLVVADGIGVVWAAGTLGETLKGRVPGIDLVERLFEGGDAADLENGLRVFLLGARPPSVAGAAHRIGQVYPEVRVVGHHHGYFNPEDDEAIVAAINEAEPDLLLVGLGAPKQEFWIRAHIEQLRVPVSVGIGGAFDIWSGIARRAPRWAQALHLEWLYRLVSEPRRFRRQMVLPKFILLVLRSRLWRR